MNQATLLMSVLALALTISSTMAAPVSVSVDTGSTSKYPPIVLMHGILGNSEKLEIVADWIRDAMGDVYVRSMEIGNGPLDSVFMHMNDQVEEFCQSIYADDNLKNGFNLIGFSQGGLIGRGYIQRCNKYPVINYISWAAPQGGVFGFAEGLPRWLSVILHNTPYEEVIQNTVSIAQYWRDPYDLKSYKTKSTFLADLNNEGDVKNPAYKEQITSLMSMMLVYSKVDAVVNPAQSGWFGNFLFWTGPGENGIVVPLQDQQLYKKDFIGLKVLDDTGRLDFGISDCDHEDHPTEACKHIFDKFTLPILERQWDEVHAFWEQQKLEKSRAHLA